MIRLLSQITTLAGLVAAIISVGASALHLWQTPIALDPPATVAAVAKRDHRSFVDPARPPLGMFSQTLSRPLFFEGRRLPTPPPTQVKTETPKPPPVPPPPPPPPKPATLPDKIKLLGLVMRADYRQALIEVPPLPAAWFTVGDRVAEWTITAIEENRVLFSHRSSSSATLALYSDVAPK